jgi:hypothetical protein
MTKRDQGVRAVTSYVQQVAALATNAMAREHSYRPALVELFNALDDDVETFNDPARSEGGQPDFVFVKKSNPELVGGYGEAKDLGNDLDKVERSEQLLRYAGYDRLVLTNELEFRFYQQGERYATVTVARKTPAGVVAVESHFGQLYDEFRNFLELKPVRIRSAKKLAMSMGGKARRIRDYVSEALKEPRTEGDWDVEKLFQAVKEKLVAGITASEFADMYAQTLVYGLFSARYRDESPDTFSRQEARDLIPPTTPFLRTFFDHIAGPAFSPGLARIVTEMCDVLAASDVAKIVKRDFASGDDHNGKDPIIHFYEDFLQEYDAKQRDDRGVYYTPAPAVRFIIRGIDRLLKDEFGLPEGLADSSKAIIEYPAQPGKMLDSRRKRNGKEVTTMEAHLHRVQILDVATGTATFLNETIKHIHATFFGQQGAWPSYAKKDLVPRLNGFELMMAPYAIAHMKLSMTSMEFDCPSI